MTSVSEIQKRIDELKARKARLAALEKSREGKAKRAADTTSKILCGAVLMRHWPEKIYEVMEKLDRRDQKRLAEALQYLGIIDPGACAAIVGGTRSAPNSGLA